MSKELNDKLRKETRLLKANTRITFKYMQDYLKLSKSGFFHWINGYYDMSEERLKDVENMIKKLK